jgi:hypothetical protein
MPQNFATKKFSLKVILLALFLFLGLSVQAQSQVQIGQSQTQQYGPGTGFNYDGTVNLNDSISNPTNLDLPKTVDVDNNGTYVDYGAFNPVINTVNQIPAEYLNANAVYNSAVLDNAVRDASAKVQSAQEAYDDAKAASIQKSSSLQNPGLTPEQRKAIENEIDTELNDKLRTLTEAQRTEQTAIKNAEILREDYYREAQIKALENGDYQKAAELGVTITEIEKKKEAAAKEEAKKQQQLNEANAAAACALVNGPFSGRPFIDINCLIARMVQLLLWIFSGLVYVAGFLLELSFNYTVLNLAETFKGLAPTVEMAWKVFRDLINITFIFGLLWCAINTILDRGDYKKTLATIIIGALLVNFSLFFTKFIIDVSNNFTVVIYKSIDNGGETTLAGSFITKLGLQNVASANFFRISSGDSGSEVNLLAKIVMTGLLGAIIYAVVAFVFLIISLLLIVRFVMFIILMIKSPIAIGGGAFPQVQKMAGDWWKDLADQAMFAPIFFLMLWVVLKFVNGGLLISQKLTSDTAGGLNSLGGSNGNIEASSEGFASMILKFAIIIALLLIALTEAKKMSASGSEAITKVGGKLAGYGIAATAFMGRTTIGRAANNLNSKYGDRLKAGGRFSQLTGNLLDKTRKGNFDARSTKLGGMVADESGINFGKPKFGKGGYDSTQQKKDKATAEHEEAFKNIHLDPHAANLSILAANNAIDEHQNDTRTLNAQKVKLQTDKTNLTATLDGATRGRDATQAKLDKHAAIDQEVADAVNEAEKAKIEYDAAKETGNAQVAAQAEAKMRVADGRALKLQDESSAKHNAVGGSVNALTSDLKNFEQTMSQINIKLVQTEKDLAANDQQVAVANGKLEENLSKTSGYKDVKDAPARRAAHIAGIQDTTNRLKSQKGYATLVADPNKLAQEVSDTKRRQAAAKTIIDQGKQVKDGEEKKKWNQFMEKMAKEDADNAPKPADGGKSTSDDKGGEKK